MTFVPGIGPLWLDSIIIGTICLAVAFLAVVLTLNPAAIPSRTPVALTIAAGFGASGILLVVFGSWWRLRKRKPA